MNTTEYHFHGESTVHRKMFWMPFVLRAWLAPGWHKSPKSNWIFWFFICAISTGDLVEKANCLTGNIHWWGQCMPQTGHQNVLQDWRLLGPRVLALHHWPQQKILWWWQGKLNQLQEGQNSVLAWGSQRHVLEMCWECSFGLCKTAFLLSSSRMRKNVTVAMPLIFRCSRSCFWFSLISSSSSASALLFFRRLISTDISMFSIWIPPTCKQEKTFWNHNMNGWKW